MKQTRVRAQQGKWLTRGAQQGPRLTQGTQLTRGPQ